jgi:hypothetical protein
MKCASGIDHEAVRKNVAMWSALTFVARMKVFDADEGGPESWQEFRNCACKSTLIIELDLETVHLMGLK